MTDNRSFQIEYTNVDSWEQTWNIQLRAEYDGVSSQTEARLDFKVSIAKPPLDEVLCRNAVLTVPSDFMEADIQYELGSPAYTSAIIDESLI